MHNPNVYMHMLPFIDAENLVLSKCINNEAVFTQREMNYK